MKYSKLMPVRERRLFDPSRKEDVQDLKYFLSKYKWKGGCPFYLEEPWEDIPAMCRDKFIKHTLGIK